MVEEADILAARQFERVIGSYADTTSGGGAYPDAAANSTERIEELLCFTVLRTIIDDAPFPICMGLVKQTQGCLREPLRLRVVSWRNNTKERSACAVPLRVLLKSRSDQAKGLGGGERGKLQNAFDRRFRVIRDLILFLDARIRCPL